ncbi:MAG: hypothetical protein VYE77_03395 [Planctomycetota bacterium]|nr:hypothetical protein [Planctomycetota bacterium]
MTLRTLVLSLVACSSADFVSAQTLRWHLGASPLEQTVSPASPPLLASTGPGGFVLANDFDLDGDLDVLTGQDLVLNQLVVPPTLTSNAALVEGLLPQTGNRVVSLSPFTDAVAVDLDGDGDLDYVAVADFPGGMGLGGMEIRMNATPPTPGATVNFVNPLGLPGNQSWLYNLFVGSNVQAIEAIDVDNDGDADLVMGSDLGLTVRYNDPHPTNPPPARSFAREAAFGGPAVSALASGNLDGADPVDLVRVGPGSVVEVLMTTGVGAAPFAAPIVLAGAPLEPTCVTVADIDGDAADDVLVGYRAVGMPPTQFAAGGVEAFLNAAGAFAPFQLFGSGVGVVDQFSASAILVADLAADGVAEIVVATQREAYWPQPGNPSVPNVVLPTATRVYERPTLAAPFADQTAVWIEDDSVSGIALSGTALTAADYDLDGDLDLLVSYAGRPFVGVFTSMVAQLDAPLDTAVGATSIDYTLFGDIPSLIVLGVALDRPQFALSLPGFVGLLAPASYATVSLVGASGPPWTTSYTMSFPPGFAGTALFAQAAILSIDPQQPRNSFASVQRSVIR